jgi:flagellin-like protein
MNPKRRDRKKMKILKNKKALSPVVASIILIAVTVAVSIAVAAWMGALTFSFMGGTENVRISYVQWDDPTTHATIYITVDNEGTAVITLKRVYVNNVLQGTHNCTDVSIDPGTSKLFSITYTWAAGQTYDITVETAQNNKFSTVATPPG